MAAVTAADEARAYLTPSTKPAMFARSLVEHLLAEHDAATVRAEQAEEELVATIEALSARLHDEWGVQASGSGHITVAGDEDDARRSAARYSRYHLFDSEPTAYHVVRRQVTDWTAAGTALSATQAAPESAQGSADTNISSSPATEPTEAEPCPSCRETYCDDGKPRPA